MGNKYNSKSNNNGMVGACKNIAKHADYIPD